MVDFDQYETTLPFSREDNRIRDKYLLDLAKKRDKFFKDAAEYYGYEDHPKREILERMAWEEGHSFGYYSVFNWIEQLVQLIS